MAKITSTSALVLRDVGNPLKLENVTLASLQPNEAVVEIHASGICHTDLSCMSGVLPAALPNVLGHEGAGIVREVGSDVLDVAPGDKVLLSFNFCDTCENCTAAHPAYCSNFVPLNFGGVRADGSVSLKSEQGTDIHCNFFGQSSFSRHAIVAANSMVKVPADTDLRLYAPLGCGLQTGAGAILKSLAVTEGSSVAVWGVGPVGLAAVMASAIANATVIIAIDLQPDRLELAKSLGATHTINGSDEDVVKKVVELSKSNGVQFALDCTGVPEVVENMVNSLGTRGRGCTVGAPKPGAVASIDIFTHLIQGREYIGCTEGDCIPSKMIPYLIEQHKAGKFPLEKMIKYYEIKNFQQAFTDMAAAKTIKPVIVCATSKIDWTTFRNLINGKLVDTKDHSHGINPATRERLQDVPVATKDDLDEAVRAARAAFRNWRNVPREERNACVLKYADAIEANADELAKLLTTEQGKPTFQAAFEIGGCAAWLRAQSTLFLEDEVLEDSEEKKILTRYTPIGVVGAIVPWNFPCLLNIGKIGPAVLTGNTIIVKPSPFTPYTALKLAELAMPCFPPGVVQTLAGDDDLGPWMTSHKGIDKISFTGSTATGKKVAAMAAATMKRVTLELGGNDPAIICSKVDIPKVAPGICTYAMLNSGQICLAIKRVYIHSSIYSEFRQAMVDHINTLKVGDGFAADTFLGPVQNEMQYNKVKNLFDDIEKEKWSVA
ncbi:hypothetical protein B0A49_12082, partial [Cryomyces minteri]